MRRTAVPARERTPAHPDGLRHCGPAAGVRAPEDGAGNRGASYEYPLLGRKLSGLSTVGRVRRSIQKPGLHGTARVPPTGFARDYLPRMVSARMGDAFST